MWVRFQHEFECVRVESDEVNALLQEIRGGEFWESRYCLAQDYGRLGALADLLASRGDPRVARVAEIAATKDYRALWPLFALSNDHTAYLRAFSKTRRMKRDPVRATALPDPLRIAVGLPIGDEAGYYVGGAHDVSILDPNKPPRDQPSLWCDWRPSEDGTEISARHSDKFRGFATWLEYIIERFLQPWGYHLYGQVEWDDSYGQKGLLRLSANEPC